MIIVNEVERTLLSPAGKITVVEATGICKEFVRTGDRIKLGTAAVEQFLNGSFEDDFDHWTEGGTPKIETGNVYDGAKSCELEGTESVEQTLDSPVPTNSLLNALRRFKVVTCFPVMVGKNLAFYHVKLSRLYKPYSAGRLSFWWSIPVPHFYGDSNGKWKVTITYTDATTTVVNFDETKSFNPSGYSTWQQEDITEYLSVGKNIQKIKIERVAEADVYVDLVECLV